MLTFLNHLKSWRCLDVHKSALATAFVLATASPQSQALDFFWDGEIGDVWDAHALEAGLYTTNWSMDGTGALMLPGISDVANFDQGNSHANRYVVTGITTQNQRLLIHNDAISLNLPTGVVYELISDTILDAGVVVGVASGDSGDLLISGGGTLRGSFDSAIGEAAGSSGVVTVTGSGTTWETTFLLYVGERGDGVLRIEQGATVSSLVAGLGASSPDSSGTVTVTGAGSNWNNSGRLFVGLIGNGDMTIMDSAVMTTDEGIIGHSSSSESSVTVTGQGSIWRNTSSLYVGGFDSFAGGTSVLHISAGGAVEVGGATTIWEPGTINLSAGSFSSDSIDHTLGGSLNFLGGTLSVALFDGDLLNQGGTLAPGQSPGITTITGDYTQLSSATLALEIGGTSQGTQFDLLNVQGDTILAGTLEFTIIDGFDPTDGDRFDILDWGTLSGSFDTVLLPTLIGGLAWNIDDLYLTGELSIEIETLTGDYTGDGYVGVEDLDLLLANWGNMVSPGDQSLGDGSGDGIVGEADLDILISNWGAGTPLSGVVPEPGSLAIAAIAGLALLRRQR